MEGIPRVPMFAPAYKIPYDPWDSSLPGTAIPDQLSDKIREYILTNYQDDPSKFNSAIEELISLRKNIAKCFIDVEALCVMRRYYSQLLLMKRRFPMEQNESAATLFSWIDQSTDAYNSVPYVDINFELCCVLFNIGAVHAMIAANEARTNLDSIKNAFTHFQSAAWPFKLLRDELPSSKFPAITDFEESLLSFYLNILLAQAQECVLEKSIIDQRKPLINARIALHLHNVYDQCLLHLENSSISELIPNTKYKDLLFLSSSKSELYGALVHFYLGLSAADEKKMGLRLAHFTNAEKRIERAVKIVEKCKRESLKEAIQFTRDVILQKQKNAQTENDIIYHERVPNVDKFDGLEGVVLAKPIGFDPFDPSVAGDDLFKELLPVDVVKSISLYSEEKDKLKKSTIDKASQKDEELENFLISLKLDQLNLDQPDDNFRLPDELLSASAAFTAQPNLLPDLLDNFQRVTTLSSDAERELISLSNRLKNICSRDLKSDDGYKVINSKVQELMSHHSNARTNNLELQRAISSHSDNLKLLSLPLPELTKHICGGILNTGSSPEGKNLQKILEKVEDMKKQRAYLVDNFTHELDCDDISQKALVERGLDGQKLFKSELAKHNPNINLIQQNCLAQENIVKALTDANADFAEYRQQIFDTAEKRKVYSLTLVTAYRILVDVTEKTSKAIVFYKQLTSLIEALKKGANYMEEADQEAKRKVEQERILAQKQIAAKEAHEAVNEFAQFR